MYNPTRLHVEFSVTDEWESTNDKVNEICKQYGLTSNGSGMGFGLRDMDFDSDDKTSAAMACGEINTLLDGDDEGFAEILQEIDGEWVAMP